MTTASDKARGTRELTSRLMTDFLRLVEKYRQGERLTQEELLSSQFRGDALAFAKTMMRWIKKGQIS